MKRFDPLLFLVALFLGSSCTVYPNPNIGKALHIGDEVLKDYHPMTTLVTEKHLISKAKYPVVDVHTHFGLDQNPEAILGSMDALGVKRVVNLSGGWGEKLNKILQKFKNYAPERFIIMCNIDFSRIDETDFGEKVSAFLEEAHSKGAEGLKIFKSLGLSIKDKSGKIVPVDDPRLDSIWAKAGELGMPVLIHVADPTAFFHPIDRFNERWLQLKRHPSWSFDGNEFPSKDSILKQRNNVLAKHRNTLFIGPHIGSSAEDLKYLSELLDKYSNFYVDISGRVAELGRQPYLARKFFIKYQDRILFGTDRYPGKTVQPRYSIYYRFLETADEYFDYYKHPFPPTGEWKIYGIFLPNKVLRKVYYENSEKIFKYGTVFN
ncbi:MAG: amidohydrolase family protein [Nitrospinota bacterium]|jgi:predicted TIM-barrel fold metal-dependent hydrolase|nr:amidohydrolase family protein [Nitrospinota bacterium]HJN02929.1 amidohydrolase family protein [Nitrospinota bacterium]